MLTSDELRRIANDLDALNSMDIGTRGRVEIWDESAEPGGTLEWDGNNCQWFYYGPGEKHD